MSFHPNDNPLKNVRVQRFAECSAKDCLVSMLFTGSCPRCRRSHPLPVGDAPVFERLGEIKRRVV